MALQVSGANGSVPVGARVEQLIAATGLNYSQFALALAGFPYRSRTPAKGSSRWRRFESARRQLRRWRIGGQGLERPTALRLVQVTNRVLEEQGMVDRFPAEYLVEAEPPRATLERLDMKLELVLARLDAIEERLE